MRRRLTYGLWLVLVWLALWADASVANVLGGVVVAAAVLTVFPPREAPREAVFRPLAFLRFLAFFLGKLVEASAIVAWEVLTPRSRVREGIVAVPLRGVSDVVTTVVANAISLVPGTLTIEARKDPCVLYVHVLHLRDPEAVRREVRQFEALAARAFGPRGTVIRDDELPDDYDASQAAGVLTEEEAR